MAVGIMLACAGVLLQTLTRNPMASPEVLGISSGVALAVIAAFLAFPALGSGGLLLAGAGGALMVAVLVLWLARRLQPAWLLVTGVAIAALMQGVMTVVQLSGNPQLQGVLSWLAGSTWYARPHTDTAARSPRPRAARRRPPLRQTPEIAGARRNRRGQPRPCRAP